jgi:hypothetical protein
LPVRYSQTDWSKLFIEIAAIHSSQAFFMSHHFGETVCTTLVFKNAQRAGLGRQDCKIHSDAFAVAGAFQNNMSMHNAIASRLR